MGESFPCPFQRDREPEGVGTQPMTHMFQRRALGWLRAGSFARLPIVLWHVPEVAQVTVYAVSGRWVEKAKDEHGRAGRGLDLTSEGLHHLLH